MKILVTGFVPFSGKSNNTSWDVVELLPEHIGDAEIVKAQMSVSFDKAPAELKKTIEEAKPDVIVMVGETKSDSKLRIERVALNLMDSAKPDNDGYTPIGQAAQTDGDTAYITPFDVRGLVNQLKETGHEATISNSAGTYVCNRLYYEALYAHKKALFVHVPHREWKESLYDISSTITDLLSRICHT